MSTRVPQVVYLSSSAGEAFARALADLKRWAEVIECSSASQAAQYLQEARCAPELILVCQSRPGEYDLAELDALVRQAPLARFVHLLGSWCEGETRTGRPWAGAKRVFWYDWPGEAIRNFSGISSGAYTSWTAPATSLEEERWLVPAFASSESAGSRQASHSEANFVLVCTRRSSFGEALTIACRQEGYASVWLSPSACIDIQGVGAILWEGVQLLTDEEAELRQLASRFPQVPILAFADFPRLETERRAIAAGARAMLAKPLVLADVVAHLEGWLSPVKARRAGAEQAA